MNARILLSMARDMLPLAAALGVVALYGRKKPEFAYRPDAGPCFLADGFLEEVQEKGQYLRERIAAMESPYVTGIRGMGLMLGVGVQGMKHSELKDKLLEAGLLALTAGKDTLRLLPPLTITREELDRGLAIMEKVMK